MSWTRDMAILRRALHGLPNFIRSIRTVRNYLFLVTRNQFSTLGREILTNIALVMLEEIIDLCR